MTGPNAMCYDITDGISMLTGLIRAGPEKITQDSRHLGRETLDPSLETGCTSTLGPKWRR